MLFATRCPPLSAQFRHGLGQPADGPIANSLIRIGCWHGSLIGMQRAQIARDHARQVC
jgi:hypothetical protein